MGQFRIEITAVGGHGCDRTTTEGDRLQLCQRFNCPDCVAVEFVERFNRLVTVESATLTHWPGTPQEVQDDLLAGKRAKGNF